MVSEKDISQVINSIISEYTLKCGRNKISSSGTNYVRFGKGSRETMEKFINETCDDNYKDTEELWVFAAGGNWEGSLTFKAYGDEESVELSYDQRAHLYNSHEKNGMMYHEIHNHPHKNDEGYATKMPECLSPDDILQCITNDWSKSITAVNGRNGSKMILMKSSDFSHDFESEAMILTQAYKLSERYFDYMNRWESETRKVWDNDEENGALIAKEIMKNPPKDLKGGIVPAIHAEYERIAMKNIGTFEENITDIRSNLNKYGLDISIEV